MTNTIGIQTWVDKYIQEYQGKKKELQRYRMGLDKDKPEDREDAELIASMIRDMQLAITWMKRGRRPGSLRGADKQDIYRRNAIRTALTNANLVSEDVSINAICILSSREQECFLAYHVEGLTQNEIADMLKVARSTVRVTLRRAESKLARYL